MIEKIKYSKGAVEQEAQELLRDNEHYRAGIKFAVERFEECLRWELERKNPDALGEARIYWRHEMQDLYTTDTDE